MEGKYQFIIISQYEKKQLFREMVRSVENAAVICESGAMV